MRYLLTLLALLCLVAVGRAEPVDQARAAWSEAAAAVRAAATRQARVRAEHEAVVRRVSARKAAAPNRIPGVGDGALDALLKRAHDLAASVEAADRAIAAARQQVAARRLALLQAIDRQLGLVNRQLASGDDATRRAAFGQMQALASERARLMAAAQGARPETVRLPAVADGASAEELRELADEASDNAERVRSQLAALEARLSALNARKLMLRAANAFDTDTSLFAENERNRQVARAARVEVAAAGGGGGAVVGDRNNGAPMLEPGGQADDAGGQEAAPPPAEPETPARGSEGGFDAQDPDTDGDGLTDLGESPPVTPIDVVMPSVAPQAGGTGGAVVFETALDPALLAEDVDDLSPAAVAEQLRALRKKQAALRKAADELARRRAALEKRADRLEQQ